MKKRAVLWLLLIVVCVVINQGVAILTIRQGRRSPGSISTALIVGVATVELGGLPTSRPTYYFDCISNSNNGSGIRWTRVSAQHRFQVVDIPDGSPGKRMDATGIDYVDLDVYTCSDQYSNQVTSVNISASNPAVMAALETVGVVQGLTAQLEVYISGFPTPTSSHITWYDPSGTDITDTRPPGVTFQDSGRRVVLASVQPQQAGLYECTVVLSPVPYMGATTSILLEVYVPPTITTDPRPLVSAREWNEVILTCSASATPTPTIRWEREEGAVLPVGAVPTYSTSGNIVTSNLTFERVRYEHRGRYRCVADNGETNPAVSQYADIRITPALRLEDETMQQISGLYSVGNEARVRLECLGTGNLQWTSSTGFQIRSDQSGNIYQTYDHTRDALALVIQNFTTVTIDTYTCMTNLTDVSNMPITSSVLITSANPSVIIESDVQHVLLDSSTSLDAMVFASPLSEAIVQWYHEGRLIDDAIEPSYTASSAGNSYRLIIDRVTENEIGEYSIVVILNGANATDRITLRLPDLPSATITPTSITVTEGEEARFTCNAQGSGVLEVAWALSGDRPLPVGVQENGNSIYIASATSSHPGTYVCSVINLAGTGLAEATLTVYYSPTAVISYNGTMSMHGTQPLFLNFDDGARGPTITCSANGCPRPTVEWIRENGRGLPSGIVQQDVPSSSSNGEVATQLRWRRDMEFTDSGFYVCRAFSNGGTYNATLELLVQFQPTLISISPATSIIPEDSQHTSTFSVPLDHVGRVLTCTATGWPAPVVEWHKNNVPVPNNNGIVSQSVTTSATVSASLMWTRGFVGSDNGSYQCVVYKQNTNIPVTTETVQLNARQSTTTLPTTPQPCSVQQTSIHFQIRVFATDCERWEDAERTEIANNFRTELLSVIRTECSCVFEESSIKLSGAAQCSTRVSGAAVFRGQIKTDSQPETEQIFCSLRSWQQKPPLILIDGQLRAVDGNCSLEASGSSSNGEECAAPTDSTSVLGLIEIVAIAGGGVCFILSLMIILLICCLCCCYRRRKKVKVTKDDHIYTRTESFSRYSRDGVGLLSRNGRRPGMIRGDEPTYSSLTRETMDHQSHPHPESIALSQIHSTSSENLINPDSVDGGARVPSRSRVQQTAAEPAAYQVPISSRENLTSVGKMENVGRFQAGNSKRHVSSTSSYDSTSHLLNRMQNPRPSNSSIEDNTNDYEDISGDDGSVCDSPTPSGKAHGRSSVGSAHIYHQLTESRKHSDATAPSASFFVGEGSPRAEPRGTVSGSPITNGFTHKPGSQVLPKGGGRPQRSSETTRTPLQQASYSRIGDGSHTAAGSSSSPHNMKQELMAQFQSVDDMATRPRAAAQELSNNNYPEFPPPYTSRPSSEAILRQSESGRDSPMLDNAAYGGISHEKRPWYESDVSLNSNTPQTTSTNASAKREQIEPSYAMIHNGHNIPHSSWKGSGANVNNNSNGHLRSDSRQESEITPHAELGTQV